MLAKLCNKLEIVLLVFPMFLMILYPTFPTKSWCLEEHALAKNATPFKIVARNCCVRLKKALLTVIQLNCYVTNFNCDKADRKPCN